MILSDRPAADDKIIFNILYRSDGGLKKTNDKGTYHTVLIILKKEDRWLGKIFIHIFLLWFGSFVGFFFKMKPCLDFNALIIEGLSFEMLKGPNAYVYIVKMC